MQELPLFFDQHQLAADIDERGIRRAYAKALKKIDQELQPQAFQELREQYEQALYWLIDQTARFESTLEQPTDSTPEALSAQSENVFAGHQHELSESGHQDPDFISPTSRIDAAQIDEELDVGLQRISHTPLEDSASADSNDETIVVTPAQAESTNSVSVEQVAQDVLHDLLQKLRLEPLEEKALSELNRSLDDPRLINIEVRDWFEWLIVCYLQEGWQVGNGNLFGAAVQCFCWEKDKQRVLRFGQRGYAIDLALTEFALFNQQKADLLEKFLNIVRLTRQHAELPKTNRQETVRLLEKMTEFFPNLLPLVTNFNNVEFWRTSTEYQRWLERKLVTEKPKASSLGIFLNALLGNKYFPRVIIIALTIRFIVTFVTAHRW